MRTYKLALALPALLGLVATKAHAQLNIVPTFDSTWNNDANAAADEAAITNLLATSYNANFTNPYTVTILFSDVTTGLGTSLTGYYSTSYANYRNALIADKSTANGGDGNSAFLSSLPASGNPVLGNSTSGVSFTSAQGRMLGFGTAGVVAGTYDSQVSLNMGLIGPNSGPSGGYSLTGVASHEINEVLGIGSQLNGRGDIAGTPTLSSVGAMDFFRYSAPGVHSFSSSSAVESYFSDDGGVTPIVHFNQQTGGDYHDWASAGDATDGAGVDGPPQVQDAFSTPNVAGNKTLGASEFRALNDVGLNRAISSAATPEPSSVALAFAGMGMVGMIVRRRRAQRNA